MCPYNNDELLLLCTQSFMHATMTMLHTIVSRDWAEFSYKSIKTLENCNVIRKSLTSDQSLVSIWASSYFSVCRHFATISDLLFSMSFPSCSAMANFSVRQRAHRLAWGVYALHFSKIFHVTWGVPPSSFILHTSSESLLSFLNLKLLNVFMCSFLLSLNCRFVIPL